MKKLFYIFICLLFFGCATKQPLSTNLTQAPACTLTSAANCQPVKPNPEHQVDEIVPFYESVAPTNVPELSANNSSDSAIPDFSIDTKPNVDAPIEFDIPIVMNEDVEKWITYFQTTGRKHFARYLARSGRYVPMMQATLREHGLPLDLVYLSMIESGFRADALSRAKASGPWQFMKGTGSRYGLLSNWWIDERRDPEKSSLAAAQHLRDLYEQFNHWYLAAAGYNAGAGKITRAMQRYATDDFWEMSQSQFRYLKPETKNYVPKMLAAAIIAKQPESYGFKGIVYDEPLQYTKVTVPESVEISVVAKALDIDKSILDELNPELLRSVTPPNYPNYQLKIPVGMEQKFLEQYADIRAQSAPMMVRHTVKKAESLSGIAKKYGVTHRDIMSLNNMKSGKLRVGTTLMIPVKSGRDHSSKTKTMPEASLSKPSRKATAGSITMASAQRASSSARHSPWVTYRVKRGDTLWGIAKKHGVEVKHLKDWNNISRTSLFPGKSIKIKPN